MKKFFILVFSVILVSAFSSCNSCCSKSEVECDSLNDSLNDSLSDSLIITQAVENIISTDREAVYNMAGGDYRWFETCVVLKDFLDTEDCDGTVTDVSNVFQVVEMSEDGKSADVFVILAAHTPDTVAYEVKHAFWIEDQPLNDEAITVTFKQAFERVMETNCPKPHSKHCVLRKQVGPVDANPQYIFGNTEAQVYVDAITGDVTTDNPAFPEAKGFKLPLGEWP